MTKKHIYVSVLTMGLLICPQALLALDDSQSQFPHKIGPYVQMVGTDHAYICWAELKHIVKNGITFDSLNSIKPIYDHKQYYLMAIESVMAGKREVAYQIPGIGKGIFKLAPKDRNSTFKFAVFGDNKSWHTNQEGSDEKYSKLISLLVKNQPDFVVNTGDLVFEGRDYRDWLRFFQIGQELMRNVPYYPVVGNHEVSSQPLFDMFEFPENKSYYSFNWWPVHFIVLNSCGFETLIERRKHPETQWASFLVDFEDKVEKPFFEKQLEWFESDLELHKECPFIFVSFHFPVFNTLKRSIDHAQIIRDDWVPLIEQYKISAVFNGHNHHYHHAIKNDIHYIITAGAGAGLHKRETSKFAEEVKYVLNNHFVLVNVSADSCKFEVINFENMVIDSFLIEKRK